MAFATLLRLVLLCKRYAALALSARHNVGLCAISSTPVCLLPQTNCLPKASCGLPPSLCCSQNRVHRLQVQFNGLTPLGTNLNKKVIQPFLAAGVNKHDLAKPILVCFLRVLLRMLGILLAAEPRPGGHWPA